MPIGSRFGKPNLIERRSLKAVASILIYREIARKSLKVLQWKDNGITQHTNYFDTALINRH